MQIIVIAAQKGGAGKTTLALHLAVEYQRAGKSVALIDTDPQRSAEMWGAAGRAGHNRGRGARRGNRRGPPRCGE